MPVQSKLTLLLTLTDFDGHTDSVAALPDVVVLEVVLAALHDVMTLACHLHLCTRISGFSPGCTPLTNPLHPPSACDLHHGTILTSDHNPGHMTLAFDPGHSDHEQSLSCKVKHDQNCGSSVMVGWHKGRECWQTDMVAAAVDGDGGSFVVEMSGCCS